MQIIHNAAAKTITVVGDSGLKVEVTAASTLNFCQRKDGGVTVWYDGKTKRETVRVSKTGALMGNGTTGRKPPKRK